jgi:hypothetical protein
MASPLLGLLQPADDTLKIALRATIGLIGLVGYILLETRFKVKGD